MQGLTCLTAQIIHKEAKPDPNLTLPDENNLDQFYGIECEHERLFILTNIVSSFKEDDNSVRIIVIPTTEHRTGVYIVFEFLGLLLLNTQFSKRGDNLSGPLIQFECLVSLFLNFYIYRALNCKITCLKLLKTIRYWILGSYN